MLRQIVVDPAVAAERIPEGVEPFEANRRGGRPTRDDHRRWVHQVMEPFEADIHGGGPCAAAVQGFMAPSSVPPWRD